VVTFGVPQYAMGRDRRSWARDLHADIRAMQQY
jgi:Mlc titration factor MtfA (ptsG expression regulator)